MADTPLVDEVRMSKLVELRTKADELDSEILAYTDKEVLDEAEEQRYQDLCTERDEIEKPLKDLEAKAARSQEIRSRVHREIRGLPDPVSPSAELFNRSVAKMDFREARDGALRTLGDRDATFMLSAAQGDMLDREVRSDSGLARRVIVTENEHYRSAWFKYMTQPSPIYTAEEQHALLRYQEYRIQTEGATTAGGFAIPVFIDPSVILTDQETNNPFLTIARQVTVNTNQWKGVSAAGVSWSFDAETAQVSDDSITIAQPAVGVYMARGFIPYSIEVGDDWPGFQAEMARLLAAGYDELLVSSFTTGAGTAGPRGIVTALDANTNSELRVTTQGAFGDVDIYRLWKALPQKYQRNSTWMSSVDVNNKIRQMGTALGHAYTINLTQDGFPLFEQPTYTNPYMSDFSSSASLAYNLLVVGDFSNYVIARNRGMEVELVPHLMGSNDFPRGMRGWFAHARIGGNSVNDAAFRLLVNTA